jgi:heme/copper-type cytochrome/quinol oxidase subunit 4
MSPRSELLDPGTLLAVFILGSILACILSLVPELHTQSGVSSERAMVATFVLAGMGMFVSILYKLFLEEDFAPLPETPKEFLEKKVPVSSEAKQKVNKL